MKAVRACMGMDLFWESPILTGKQNGGNE